MQPHALDFVLQREALDLTVPIDEVAPGRQAIDVRRAIETTLRP